jgi:TonB-linked SusC/RagA family outer membrane protein
MRKTLSLLTCFMACCAIALAQGTRVTGKVVDSTGAPVAFASVTVKGTKTGATTDMDGAFSITLPENKKILIFSAIGYQSQELTPGSGPVIIKLTQSSVDALKDVIVSGVASATSRKNMTVSVTKIDEDRLNVVPATSAASALSGKVAGVRVNSSGGTPGGGLDLLLRGDNNLNIGSGPLIMLDGIILSGSLTDINVDDVESMEVIKGASASSLYGSRAGNGVIAITTKRGSKLNANTSKITIRNEIGFQSLQKYIDLSESHPFTLASDWETYKGQYTKYNGVTYPSGYMGGFNPEITGARTVDADHYMDNPFGVTKDQQKEFFSTGMNYTNFVGISTKSRLTNLYASFENNSQEGIIQYTNGYKRQNFRLNLDHQIAPWLKLSASNLYINTNSQAPGDGGGIFFNIVLAEPDNNLNLPHPDGQPYYIRHNHWSNERNPLYSVWKNKREDYTRRWIGNYSVNLKLTKWLNIDASRTIEIENYRYTSYNPYDTWTLGASGGPLGIIYSKGSLYKYSYESNTQNTQATINLTHKIGDLAINGKLSYLYEDRHEEDFSVNGSRFSYRDLPTMENFIPDNITDYGSSMYDYQAQNYFAILSLNYANRFLLDGMYRYDGSSLFGKDEKWHPYFRVSGAYRISQDVTLPGIDELKIRAAHGTAGLRPGFNWQYEAYSLSNGSAGAQQIGNSSLKPSQTAETEVGLNVEFLRKFYFEATYAQSKTTDQFLNVPLTAFLNGGYPNQWQNAGTIESKTLELTLGANWLKKKDFTWNTNIVFSRITQKITELPIPPYQGGADGLFYIREGEVYGAIYGYDWVRTLAQMEKQLPTGKTIADYEVNSDGYVVPAKSQGTVSEKPVKLLDDKGNVAFVKIGNGNPDFNMGISNTIGYKGFQLYVLVDIKKGGDVYNRKSQWLTRDSRNGIMDMAGVDPSKKKTYDYFQAFYDVNTNNSYWVEDAGFIKFREVALGYTFPQKTLGVFKGIVKGASARIIGRNLLTITDYSGYDPEVGSIRNPYDGTGTYPNFRNLAFSLSLEF